MIGVSAFESDDPYIGIAVIMISLSLTLLNYFSKKSVCNDDFMSNLIKMNDNELVKVLSIFNKYCFE